jgi:hypothetical protein
MGFQRVLLGAMLEKCMPPLVAHLPHLHKLLSGLIQRNLKNLVLYPRFHNPVDPHTQ